ncbi:MAG: hypothetical protein K6T73_08925 [Candidatus Bathyarchaeota archaeon]|nr:hypothetical protein [Candidatus Bathyarchaeota archaeon]
MKKHLFFLFQTFLFLIIMIGLYPKSVKGESSSYSFVYCYGNTKIWVFIEANRTVTVNPDEDCSLFLTVYLERLGNNVGVFLNRVTFKLEGTQLIKTISPNVTLQSDIRSWSYNVTFKGDEVSSIIKPGQIISGEMTFELRYDIIDSYGEIWPFRVNEEFPILFKNIGQTEQPWMNFETVFIIVLLFGATSALALFLLRICKYKKEHASYPISTLTPQVASRVNHINNISLVNFLQTAQDATNI